LGTFQYRTLHVLDQKILHLEWAFMSNELALYLPGDAFFNRTGPEEHLDQGAFSASAPAYRLAWWGTRGKSHMSIGKGRHSSKCRSRQSQLPCVPTLPLCYRVTCITSSGEHEDFKSLRYCQTSNRRCTGCLSISPTQAVQRK